VCNVHGRDEKCIDIFLSGNQKERDLLEDLCVDGRILLKWVLKLVVRGCGLDSAGSG
jgi:hypothetical protein